MNFVWSNSQSLKYQRFTLEDCRDIRIENVKLDASVFNIQLFKSFTKLN